MRWYRRPSYILFLVIGLGACVAVPLYLSFGPYKDEPGSKVPLYAAIVTVGIFMAILFVVQIRGTKNEPLDFSEPEQRPRGPADPPLGWKALSAQMAVAPQRPAEQALAEKQMKSGVLSQMKLGGLLTICIIGGGLAFISGAPVWVYIPAFVMILVLVARLPATIGAARTSLDVHVRPLGLNVAQIPQSHFRMDTASGTMRHHVEGPTVFAGDRHGRNVRVELNSRTYRTRVNGKFAKFSVTSDEGRLQAGDDCSPEVRGLIQSLGADPRWNNVKVKGTREGITVERKAKTRDAEYALWLDDLWLAEALAGRVSAAV